MYCCKCTTRGLLVTPKQLKVSVPSELLLKPGKGPTTYVTLWWNGERWVDQSPAPKKRKRVDEEQIRAAKQETDEERQRRVAAEKQVKVVKTGAVVAVKRAKKILQAHMKKEACIGVGDMVCVSVPKDCHDATFQDLNRRVLRVYDVTKTKTHAMLVYPDTQRGVQGVDGDEVRFPLTWLTKLDKAGVYPIMVLPIRHHRPVARGGQLE